MIPDIERINMQLMKASDEFTIPLLCRAFGIARSVFYYRRKRYEEYGLLQSRPKRPKRTRTISEDVKARIAELHGAHGWKAARISRELSKQGLRLSERTVRKYVPKHIELKWKSRYPKRQYS